MPDLTRTQVIKLIVIRLLRRLGIDTKPLDLTGVDLTGAVLREADLSKAMGYRK